MPLGEVDETRHPVHVCGNRHEFLVGLPLREIAASILRIVTFKPV